MKRKNHAALLFVVLALALLLTALGGCGKPDVPEQTSDPVEEIGPGETTEPTVDPVDEPEPDEASEPETEAGLQDGQRFEAVIMIEGMEETVQYEHARNEAAGFEMDFDYEMVERQSDANGERFVSLYDDPQDPMNYLEVAFRAEGAEAAAVALQNELTQSFRSVEAEPYQLEGAGACTQVSAYDAADGQTLQTVYIIPAAGGCLVAREHCTLESAEGFGVRFDQMLHTLSLIKK